MRKLLVIALLAALVPFAVGCRIDGLWGYDDDDTVAAAATTTTNIVPVIKLPLAAGVLASFQGENPNSMEAYLKLATTSTLGTSDGTARWLTLTPTVDITGGNLFFAVPAGTTVKGTDLFGGQIVVRFKSAAKGILDVTLVTATTSTTGTTTTTYSYAFVVDFGTTAVAPTVTYVSSTTTSYTTTTFPTTGLTTITVTVSDPTTGALKLATTSPLQYKATAAGTYADLSQDAAKPTNIGALNLQNFVFKVSFAEAVQSTSAVTFSMTADNTKTTTSTTISALTGNATAVWATDGKSVEITVTGSVALSTTGAYKLTLTNFSGASASGGKLVLPINAYFQPDQTTFTGITVNGTAYTATVPSVDPANAGKTTIVVTMDDYAPASANGVVTLKRYAETGRTTLEATYTISAADNSTFNATNKTWTITFNQALTANKFYTVEYVSGSVTDANGNPVKVTSPIQFATGA